MKAIIENIEEKATEDLIKESLTHALSYKDYRKMIDELAVSGSTTGSEQTESLINYTQLNSRRMKRWDKTVKIPDELKHAIQNTGTKIIWLVLTESWCGDAAPSMPVINKIAELNSNITLKVLLRDENPELMNRFLTQGAMSIPKLIMVDESNLQVLGDWGPRPTMAMQMATEYKRNNGALTPEFKEDLQVWYNGDKGQGTLKDLVQLLTLE